jgi:hypothetical protein
MLQRFCIMQKIIKWACSTKCYKCSFRFYRGIDKIVTKILDYAKDHQIGRVTLNVTNVTFNFTEGSIKLAQTF